MITYQQKIQIYFKTFVMISVQNRIQRVPTMIVKNYYGIIVLWSLKSLLKDFS